MPAKKKAAKAARSVERRQRRKGKNKVAIQPAGMPSGKHLAGFKGMKVEDTCLCAGCNPKAKENRGKAKVISP